MAHMIPQNCFSNQETGKLCHTFDINQSDCRMKSSLWCHRQHHQQGTIKEKGGQSCDFLRYVVGYDKKGDNELS